MSDAPEPYDLDFETPAPVARKVPARAPGVPQPAPARAPGFPQPAPAPMPAPAPVVRAQRVTTFADRKPTCASCNQAITDSYYSAGKKIICPECHARIMGTGAGAATLRIFKAIVFGTVAGLIGAAIWMAVRHGSDREFGLIALLLGFLVGAGVRLGSGNRGGIGYQILAVVLTYLAVAANYTPDAYSALMDGFESRHSTSAMTTPGATAAQPPASEPSAALKIVFVVIAFFFAMILPFLALPQNLIGVVIIGIALWEAWKINVAGFSSVAGPFSVRTRAPI